MDYLGGQGPVRPGLLHRGGPGPSARACGSTPRRPGPASSPRTCSAGRASRPARAGFSPNFTIIDVPVVQGRSGHRGDPDRDGDPRPPPADGDHHRRDRVRRRDQEVGLHGHELPDARRGRPADALGGERGPGRRLGDLLRPQRHRQDDPLGRPAAQPHRRRRARLGRRRRLQLRGRLLRQDDPPEPDVRAGHLPDDPPLRDDPRERRPRSADPRARPRLGPLHREHPRAPTRSTSSATPTRPGSPVSRSTSSCSPPMRSASCRRSPG